jgi:hypothetical protein
VRDRDEMPPTLRTKQATRHSLGSLVCSAFELDVRDESWASNLDVGH